MKNMRKLLAIVLCLLLVTTSFATVSAEEGEFSGIVSKTVEVSENGDVELIIDIAGNPGLISLILDVSYDSDVLTLKENGFTDTGLLKGNIDTTLTVNPFHLSWQHSDATAANNYANGTIARLAFKMKEGFYGTTDVEIKYNSGQTLVNSVVVRPPAMQSGVISVTRPKLAIKDGVVVANSVNGETLIIASYCEEENVDGEGEVFGHKDVMIDCKVYPNSTGDVKLTIADEINTTGATKVKAFLWENLETIVPVCDCAEEELNITDIN